MKSRVTDSPPVNPYAPPAEIATANSARFVAITRKFLILSFLFAGLRGVSSGFATLIVLVHLSGTAIHWDNVVPMLTVALAGCFAFHWVEWKFRFPHAPTLLIGFIGYVVGVEVVGIAGKLDYLPNPF